MPTLTDTALTWSIGFSVRFADLTGGGFRSLPINVEAEVDRYRAALVI
ncbi:hypothetical protein KHS38_15000 [Mucilaginibacter sp. Bleaf8]|nr:hypothetical protein [Mucilaginibacter sp. Bleaf8]MBS7565718.1 hypothetical protein [Mucilaginibacter sp. Bleaf8]